MKKHYLKARDLMTSLKKIEHVEKKKMSEIETSVVLSDWEDEEKATKLTGIGAGIAGMWGLGGWFLKKRE